MEDLRSYLTKALEYSNVKTYNFQSPLFSPLFIHLKINAINIQTKYFRCNLWKMNVWNVLLSWLAWTEMLSYSCLWHLTWFKQHSGWIERMLPVVTVIERPNLTEHGDITRALTLSLMYTANCRPLKMQSSFTTAWALMLTNEPPAVAETLGL